MSKSPRSSAGTRFDQSFWTNFGRTPSSPGDRLGDIDLEAPDLARHLLVFEDVRLPALQVAGPG